MTAASCSTCGHPFDQCPTCGHLLDPHVLVETGRLPQDGGIMVCPVRHCTCWRTWSPEGVPEELVFVPNMDEVLAIRARIQGVAM